MKCSYILGLEAPNRACHCFALCVFAKCTKLGKVATLGNMRPTLKIAPKLEKFAALGKMRHTYKNAPHLPKCATLKKIRQSW